MVKGYPAWLCALTAEAPRDADMWARCQHVGGLPLAGRVVFTCVDSGMPINMDGRGREPDQVCVGRLWGTVTHEEGYVTLPQVRYGLSLLPLEVILHVWH